MKNIYYIVLAVYLLLVLPGRAEREYFVGTKTGLKRTSEVFVQGKYKDKRLFLITGTDATGSALSFLAHLRSSTTFAHDVSSGAHMFGDQLTDSIHSIPENGSEFAESLLGLIKDPVEELSSPSIITPAKIIWRTVANVFKAGFYGTLIAAEPAGRTVFGTAALVAGPLIKPVSYTAVGTAILVTGTYGYGSSAAGGAVMSGATGAVLVMDLATSPFVGLYNQLSP